MDCNLDPAAYLFGSSIFDCPAIMSSENITVRSDSSSSINEDKLTAIETFIEAFEKELKAKRANIGLIVPVKNQLMQAALIESRLEGQVHELRLENKRLNQRIEMAQVQIARHDMDSAESLKTERLEGQVDILRDENNKLSVQVESLKLDVFKLNLENAKLKEENTKLKEEKGNNEDEGHKAKLEAEIRILKEENELIKNNRGFSYATAASLPAIQKPPSVIEARIAKAREKQANVLFFKSTEKKSSKEVKEAITKTINPREEKVKIKAIRTTPNTVIVETATKEDATKITQKTASLQNIVCEESKKRRPMVIIYQVPTSFEDNEFMENLYDMNLSDTISEEEFKNEVKLKFKTGRKTASKANYVLEVSPRIWNTFLRTERVYMDFESLKVKDFTRVSRCYKCHDLGHTSGQCKLETAVCYKCAKPGHIKANCKEAAIGCIPCYYRRKPHDHSGEADCPIHKQLLDKLSNNIDYGQ